MGNYVYYLVLTLLTYIKTFTCTTLMMIFSFQTKIEKLDDSFGEVILLPRWESLGTGDQLDDLGTTLELYETDETALNAIRFQPASIES